MKRNIWWIRRDLRITDNRTLTQAIDAGDEVVPLFIIDPRLLAAPYVAKRRINFLFSGLEELDKSLRKRGSRLFVRQGIPEFELQSIVADMGIERVFAHRDYSPYADKRDSRIANHVPITFVDDVAIAAPGAILKNDGQPYTVFTPYRRRWLAEISLSRQNTCPAPHLIRTPEVPEEDFSLIADAATAYDSNLFPSGETEAKRRLGAFVGDGGIYPIYDYANTRDRPDLIGTSQLSPYLRFGMVSARLCALGAFHAKQQSKSAEQISGVDTWLSELIWRDFYIGILAQFPHVRRGSFRPLYDRVRWHNDERDFAAWCAGKTGYPFIDAAMRQLSATGWMHNRARMASASFLVKDLLIDWRWGERWFMQQLLDGDPAANNGGWQWSAGTGTDAAPYFRIFNPTTQGKKFDPKGNYVRRWVPELAQVPETHIHEPWKMLLSDQIRSSYQIGSDYPEPIVDHKWARQRTLDAYKAAKEDS